MCVQLILRRRLKGKKSDCYRTWRGHFEACPCDLTQVEVASSICPPCSARCERKLVPEFLHYADLGFRLDHLPTLQLAIHGTDLAKRLLKLAPESDRRVSELLEQGCARCLNAAATSAQQLVQYAASAPLEPDEREATMRWTESQDLLPAHQPLPLSSAAPPLQPQQHEGPQPEGATLPTERLPPVEELTLVEIQNRPLPKRVIELRRER